MCFAVQIQQLMLLYSVHPTFYFCTVCTVSATSSGIFLALYTVSPCSVYTCTGMWENNGNTPSSLYSCTNALRFQDCRYSSRGAQILLCPVMWLYSVHFTFHISTDHPVEEDFPSILVAIAFMSNKWCMHFAWPSYVSVHLYTLGTLYTCAVHSGASITSAEVL